MQLPIRIFWVLNSQIARLRAEENLELVDLFLIGGMGASAEMVAEYRQAMKKTMGEPMTFVAPKMSDKKTHSEGIAKLKAILGVG